MLMFHYGGDGCDLASFGDKMFPQGGFNTPELGFRVLGFRV